MTDTKILPLLTWRRSIAESELPPTTKLVAFALSLWMNERGASAYPGADTLAKDTSLSVRAVREHLAQLVHLGWLELVEKGGLKGERRKANVYRAAVAPTPLFPNGESSVTHAPGLPVQENATTPASDDRNPCTSVTPSLQDLFKNSGRARKRAVKPPKDFQPTDEHARYAEAHALDLVGEVERWLMDCEAKGRVYKSVNAGFSTWLHHAVDFGRVFTAAQLDLQPAGGAFQIYAGYPVAIQQPLPLIPFQRALLAGRDRHPARYFLFDDAVGDQLCRSGTAIGAEHRRTHPHAFQHDIRKAFKA